MDSEVGADSEVYVCRTGQFTGGDDRGGAAKCRYDVGKAIRGALKLQFEVSGSVLRARCRLRGPIPARTRPLRLVQHDSHPLHSAPAHTFYLHATTWDLTAHLSCATSQSSASSRIHGMVGECERVPRQAPSLLLPMFRLGCDSSCCHYHRSRHRLLDFHSTITTRQ